MAAPGDEYRLLSLPVGAAVREHARRLMDKVGDAGQRLADAEDREALHDFRVALRRLRVWLRAYGRDVHVGDKLLGRLGDIMRASNRARDAEVVLPWLDAQRPTLNDRFLPGLNWLAARLEEERKYAHDIIVSHLPDAWASGARKLNRRLARGGPHRHGARFGQRAGGQMLRYIDKLAARLDDVRSIADRAAAHRARIGVKHVRYLLEPLHGEISDLDPVIARLTALQDQFGALHDASLLLDRLIAGTEAAAVEDARARLQRALLGDVQEDRLCAAADPDTGSGLLILAHRAKRQETDLSGGITEALRDDGAMQFLDRARHIGASLVTAYIGR